MRHLAATTLTLLALAAPAAAAQAEIWTRSIAPSGRAVEGSPGGAAFLGDLDGDQVADLALPVEATGIVEFRSGADGGVLGTLDPAVGFDGRIHAVQDRTGDGVAEFVAAGSSELALIDPVTGTDLWRRAQPSTSLWVGDVSIASIQDLDSDGTPDLVVGHAGEYFRASNGVSGSGSRGFVDLLSGATGAPLLRIANPDGRFGFGGHVEALGDVDGDGFQDLLIGSNNFQWFASSGFPSIPSIWSTRSGTLLHDLEVSVAFPTGSCWTRSLFVGDVDGDGAGDVLVATEDHGRAAIHSGATGAVIRQRFDPTPFDGAWSLAQVRSSRAGSTLSPAGDVDGDGVLDVWIGSPMVRVSAGGFGQWIDRGPGRVDLISGRTLETLDTIVGADRDGEFGGGVLAAPDLNGDGDGDLLVWTTNAASNGGWRLQALDTTDGSGPPRVSCLPNGPSGGRIGWAGSTSLSGPAPSITLASAPGAATALLAAGTRSAFDATAWGTTCIGGPLTRVAISATGGGGSTTVPVPTGGLLAGEGRTYQWFWRDGAGGLESSDAVSVTFLP